jgi:hypothetical protein
MFKFIIYNSWRNCFLNIPLTSSLKYTYYFTLDVEHQYKSLFLVEQNYINKVLFVCFQE